MTDKSAAAVRELAYKHAEVKVSYDSNGDLDISPNPDKINALEADLTALIEEHCYPKEFMEWATNNAECDGDGKWYAYPIAAIINSPKSCKYETALLTTDELYQYWEENVR